MLLLKKIVSSLLFPLALGVEFILLGFILITFTRKQKWGRGLLIFGVLLLCVLSYPPVADRLISPLENMYPAVPAGKAAEVALSYSERPVRWVAVLGGGHWPVPGLSPLSQLSEASVTRLAEGIRLYRELPGSRLVVSGGAVFSSRAGALITAEAARGLGVPEKDLVVRSEGQDTHGEAEDIFVVVGVEPFFLVTSASHMARAMMIFRKAGMNPIAAPTDYLSRNREGLRASLFQVDAGQLYKSQRAFYEYMGMAWAWFIGEI